MDVRRVLVCALLATLCWACDGESEGSIETPFECVGLATSACDRILADVRQQFPGVSVVRAVIRCAAAVCTDAQGEASIHVEFANGRAVDQRVGWQGEPAVNPDPSVTP